MKKDVLRNIKVPVEVVIGRTRLSLGDLSELRRGSVIELDSLAGEPAELVAAGTCIAKGEIVVIDESFGIRITAITPAGE